jgi:peptide/nickel transport system permease protein
VFGRPGLGSAIQQAVQWQDIPTVQAVVLLAALLFVTVNLIVDLLYPLLDPRVTHVPTTL